MKLIIKKQQIKDAWMFLTSTVVILFGIFVSYNALRLSDRIQNKPIIILIGVIAITLFSQKERQLEHRKTIFWLNLLFFSVLLISLFRFDGLLMSAGLFYYVSFYLLRRIINASEKQYKLICLSYLLAFSIAYARYGVATFNSQGVIISFAGTMLLNLLIIKKIENIWLYTGSVVIFVVLISLSRSRTSMLAFLMVAVLTYKTLFMKKITVKNILIVGMGCIGLYIISDRLIDFFYNVFFMKWGNADLTSNRIYIWEYVFARASILGGGINYIDRSDAHNTFVQILGSSGIIIFIVSIIVTLVVLERIIKYKNDKSIYINFFLLWFAVSMFENLDILTCRYIPVNFMLLVHLARLIKEPVEYGDMNYE